MVVKIPNLAPPSRRPARMAEASFAATQTALNSAEVLCASLLPSARCPACHQPYSPMRPYRSTMCAHKFCAVCAAIARGRLGPLLNPLASRLSARKVGHCPMPACALALRPADVVEDVGLNDFRVACQALALWADGVDAPVPSPVVLSQNMSHAAAVARSRHASASQTPPPPSPSPPP